MGGVYGLGKRKCRVDIYNNSELTGQRKVSFELCGHTDQGTLIDIDLSGLTNPYVWLCVPSFVYIP